MQFEQIKLVRNLLSWFVVLVEGLIPFKVKSFDIDFGSFKFVYRADPEKGVKVYEENED